MKHNIFALILCLCLMLVLLSGCSGADAPAEVPPEALASDGAPKAPPTEMPAQPLETEPSVPAERREILTRISDNVLAAQEHVKLYTLGENLLIESAGEFYDAASQCFAYGANLKVVSPKDGSELASYHYYLPDGWEIRPVGNYVTAVNTFWREVAFVMDAALQPVKFDGSLPEEMALKFDPVEGYLDGYWVSADLRSLYVLYSEGSDATYDLYRVDLETGDLRTLATGLVDAGAIYEGGQYVMLNYYTQAGSGACSLNLETGELEVAPVQAWLRARVGDTWLMQDFNETFTVYTPEGLHVYPLGEILDEDTLMRCCVAENIFLLNEQHLLLKGEYGWSGTLYDVSGKFISHYEFPEPVEQDDFFFTVSSPVWSEADGGYYLLVNGYESCDLYFWNIHAEVNPLPDLT